MANTLNLKLLQFKSHDGIQNAEIYKSNNRAPASVTSNTFNYKSHECFNGLNPYNRRGIIMEPINPDYLSCTSYKQVNPEGSINNSGRRIR